MAHLALEMEAREAQEADGRKGGRALTKKKRTPRLQARPEVVLRFLRMYKRYDERSAFVCLYVL